LSDKTWFLHIDVQAAPHHVEEWFEVQKELTFETMLFELAGFVIHDAKRGKSAFNKPFRQLLISIFRSFLLLHVQKWIILSIRWSRNKK